MYFFPGYQLWNITMCPRKMVAVKSNCCIWTCGRVWMFWCCLVRENHN